MARANAHYVCQACGAAHAKWSGRCDACGEWNSLIEEAGNDAPPKGLRPGAGRRLTLTALDSGAPPPPRIACGIDELDRVFGGGLVAGSAVLVSGDPGIGKSTLLLQLAAALAARGTMAAYVTGEEGAEQVRLRARRLGLGSAAVQLASATNVRDIVATFDAAAAGTVLVIDSIQTMYVDSLDSAPGSVAQVRSSAQELIRLAKRRGHVVLLVGHVTKEGTIAGPRVLEHMVDAVLHFEGDPAHQYRILRAAKNRFGATDEIGVFQMTDRGLEPVENPSALFLAERTVPVSGAAVFAGMEGTRPMLVEIEALAAPSPLGTPRRTVVGADGTRLAMILAVLETRCGLEIGGRDVYLNVAGGLRIREPAADLAVAAALVSSLTDQPLPKRTVVYGEIGLSGEVRPVSHADLRLREGSRLGFEGALAPALADGVDAPVALTEIGRLDELVALFDAAP